MRQKYTEVNDNIKESNHSNEAKQRSLRRFLKTLFLHVIVTLADMKMPQKIKGHMIKTRGPCI